MTDATLSRLRSWLESSSGEDPLAGLALAGAVVASGGVLPEDLAVPLRSLAQAVRGTESRTIEILALLPKIVHRPQEREALERGLRLRTELELCRLALESLNEDDLDLHDEDWTSAVELELALRDAAWRLTASNLTRGLLLVDIAEPHRDRFPWLTEGIQVEPSAVRSMDAVAGLVAAFPEAADHFSELVAAEREFSRVRSRALHEGGEVVDLQTARRARRGQGADVPGHRLAASPDLVLADPFVDAPVTFDADGFEVRITRTETTTGIRIVSFGDDAVDLDRPGLVRCLDAEGREVAPDEWQAMPTLWWGRFTQAAPAALWIGEVRISF